MSAIVAGTASGFVMASVFICFGSLMLFMIVKNTPPGFQPVLDRFPPTSLVMWLVIFGYPAWGIIGAVLGLVYKISLEQAPGPGMGSPNLVFTAAVVVATVMLTLPVAIVLRSVLPGVVVIALTFVGVFGWFLPYFAM